MIAEKQRCRSSGWRSSYPDFYFLLPDGVCYHGYAVSGGKKSSSGPLGSQSESCVS